jgi:hypothetical protein
MSYKGLYTGATKRPGHTQQVYGLQHTCLAAAVAPEKYINLRKILQFYLLEVSHVTDLETG